MTKYYPRVQEARVNQDFAELSRLGKKGGEAAARKRQAQKLVLLERQNELEQINVERLTVELAARRREANEDVCPPD